MYMYIYIYIYVYVYISSALLSATAQYIQIYMRAKKSTKCHDLCEDAAEVIFFPYNV